MILSNLHIRWANRSLIAVQTALICTILVLVIQIATYNNQLTTMVTSGEVPKVPEVYVVQTKPLSWYAPVWTRDLRQPPFEPRPIKEVVKPKKPAPPAPPSVRLLGTVVEANKRFGLFVDSKNKLLVCRPNDTIDGYMVMAIERGKAEIKNQQRSAWLKMPEYDKHFGEN